MEKTTNNIKLTLTEKPMSTKKSTYNKHGGGESKTSCKKKEIKICSVCCEDFTKSVRKSGPRPQYLEFTTPAP